MKCVEELPGYDFQIVWESFYRQGTASNGPNVCEPNYRRFHRGLPLLLAVTLRRRKFRVILSNIGLHRCWRIFNCTGKQIERLMAKLINLS